MTHRASLRARELEKFEIIMILVIGVIELPQTGRSLPIDFYPKWPNLPSISAWNVASWTLVPFGIQIQHLAWMNISTLAVMPQYSLPLTLLPATGSRKLPRKIRIKPVCIPSRTLWLTRKPFLSKNAPGRSNAQWILYFPWSNGSLRLFISMV